MRIEFNQSKAQKKRGRLLFFTPTLGRHHDLTLILAVPKTVPQKTVRCKARMSNLEQKDELGEARQQKGDGPTKMPPGGPLLPA